MDSDLERTELRWLHKDGRVVWTDIRVRKERDPDGRVAFLSGILRDVTAQRETERMRSLLAKALEVAGESVLITDRDGTIQYVNRGFTEITGYDPADAIGRTPRILQSGEQDESFYANLWSTIASGRTFRGVLKNRRADGRIYEQATSITPVRCGDDKIKHFISVARDITVQRALEKRLRYTEKMDAVGQLAAGVAHDFRNLLNVILVNAELLEAGSPPSVAAGPKGPPDGQQDEVDQILNATRRGADLAARLLRLASQHDPDLRTTDLAALMRGMDGMFRAIVSDSVALELRVTEGPATRIRGNHRGERPRGARSSEGCAGRVGPGPVRPGHARVRRARALRRSSTARVDDSVLVHERTRTLRTTVRCAIGERSGPS